MCNKISLLGLLHESNIFSKDFNISLNVIVFATLI